MQYERRDENAERRKCFGEHHHSSVSCVEAVDDDECELARPQHKLPICGGGDANAGL
jgi:hypothetical protein